MCKRDNFQKRNKKNFTQVLIKEMQEFKISGQREYIYFLIILCEDKEVFKCVHMQMF